LAVVVSLAVGCASGDHRGRDLGDELLQRDGPGVAATAGAGRAVQQAKVTKR